MISNINLARIKIVAKTLIRGSGRINFKNAKSNINLFEGKLIFSKLEHFWQKIKEANFAIDEIHYQITIINAIASRKGVKRVHLNVKEFLFLPSPREKLIFIPQFCPLVHVGNLLENDSIEDLKLKVNRILFFYVFY